MPAKKGQTRIITTSKMKMIGRKNLRTIKEQTTMTTTAARARSLEASSDEAENDMTNLQAEKVKEASAPVAINVRSAAANCILQNSVP